MSKTKIHRKTENIELLWHELKTFLRRVVKPTIKDEPVAGIHRFWDCDCC